MAKDITNTTEKQQETRGIVDIHGKSYMTVARRVELAHEEGSFEELYTEILSQEPVVIRATVVIKGKQYTGISSVPANSSKMIEKLNPFEVAETSAVGRALGFAGYGLIEGIASADEIHKSESNRPAIDTPSTPKEAQEAEQVSTITCETCNEPATERKGVTKAGKNYHGIFCSTGNRTHTRWLWN